MTEEKQKNPLGESSNVLGLILIGIGVLFLATRYFEFEFGRYGWPFFIIAPGVLLFLVSLGAEGRSGVVFAIVGGMVTTVGLILLYQNSSNHFESWAYAWTLVTPLSVGLAQIVYGKLRNEPEMMQTGKPLVTTGAVMFLIGFAFFEVVIGISGYGLSGFGWPIILIGIGIYLVYQNVRTRS